MRAARTTSKLGLRAGGLAAGVAALAVPAIAQDFDPRDFNGAWERYPSVFDSGASSGFTSGLSDAEAPEPAPPIPEPPLKEPLLTEWRAEQEAIREATERGEPPATHYTFCLPDGMPAMMMAMFPMEVLQTPGQVTIIQEAYNQVRRIYFDGELPEAENAEPRFWGHSLGEWDGDTLVVETVGIKENVRFRNTPHSHAMRIHEEIRLVGPNHMENVVTVTDPEFLTEPWTWTWQYQRWPEYRMQEYVCEENREYADPETGATRLRVSDAPPEE